MNTLNNRLATLRADMHAAYGHAFAADVIDAKLDEIIARHTAAAKVEDYIPVMVQREAQAAFGAHRIHVRFASGANPELAAAAVALSKKHGGDALIVDAAVSHPELTSISHLAHVMEERGIKGRGVRYLDDHRTVTMPDFIVYLGKDLAHDEAGKDIKVWNVAAADTVEETREQLDDLEARVLYMLSKLGIETAVHSQHSERVSA